MKPKPLATTDEMWTPKNEMTLGKKELYVCPKGHEFLLAEPFSINFNWFDKDDVYQHREVPTCVVCLIDRLEGMNIGVKKVQKEVS